jgi:hypothetical protein
MRWIPFINQQLGDSGPKLCDWVRNLVQKHLLPALETQGYVLSINEGILTGCILNVFYRHEQDTGLHYTSPCNIPKLRYTTYMCCHGRASQNAFNKVFLEYEAALEDKRLRSQGLVINPIIDRNELLDFYLAYKCPKEFWDTLRSKVSVEQYADDSEFANRVWDDLPMIVYWHIDHDKSAATDELDHMFMDPEDEDDSESGNEDSGTNYRD